MALATLVLTSMAGAQIPNGSFENWTDQNPDEWTTSNAPPIGFNITQTSDAHAGSWAVEGEVGDLSGFPWPPFIISGTDGQGFPWNTRSEAVHAWYQFTPLGADQLLVSVGMTHADTVIGAGIAVITQAQATYAEMVANITYISAQVPDTCIIYASVGAIGGGLPQIGSSFKLDDLSFGPATSVGEPGHVLPATVALMQNYPNPFNPVTAIQFALPAADDVRLSVFDILGHEVARLVDQHKEPGVHTVEFDAAHLPSGVYYYRLSTTTHTETRKLVLLR
jgi:hypothetical protein